MVPESALAVLFLGFVGTGLLEFFVLQIAQGLALFVEPNERSSHEQPTPSVGGLAILVPVVLLLGMSVTTYPEVRWLLGALLLLAVVGLLDDLLGLPARFRFPAQVLAVAAALYPLLPELGPWLLMPVALACLWHINLYNFMDGTDGLAGAQAVCLSLALLVLAPAQVPWLGYLCCVVAGAGIGFLVYNWAPAKIFMGDVGSTVLGLLFAIAAVLLWVTGQVPLPALLIAYAGFWVDASYTLGVRMLSGQRFLSAHRLHAYQKLARRFSHSRVATGLTVINLAWLLPLSWLAVQYPDRAWGLLLLGIAPLAWLCNTVSAGQRDPEPEVTGNA